MGLSQALSTAMSGLRANQAALSLVSSNVSNAETPGYVRKTINQVETASGNGVQTLGVNRTLDSYIQSQLRTETSGASYASVRASFLNNLQTVYGDPSSTATLESTFNALTSALQGLSTSPESSSARTAVLNAAQAMAQQLNATTQGIQSLRSSAELGLSNAVSTANNAMAQIANINKQLRGNTSQDSGTAALLDQRDQYVTQLSQLMDVRVVDNGNNQISVYTTSGVQLVGDDAAKLSFNAQGTVTPNTLWNADPSKSTLSSITVNYPSGGSLDLTANNAIRSGSIAAYLDLRDNSLVQAQNQVDQLAAAMASSLSDTTTAGTAVPATPTPGAPSGFGLDTSGWQNGNQVQFSYLDNLTGKTHNITLMRVDDASALPLSNSATSDPNDEVFGIDCSGSQASVQAQLDAIFASKNLQVTATGVPGQPGSSLQVLDDGAGGRTDVKSASITKTVSSLTSGGPQLALFTDSASLYTGAQTGNGPQQTGFAGRIVVNPGIVADPSKLVIYGSPATPAGDTTRSDYILSQLTSGTYTYSPSTGVGSSASPFKGTLLNFTQQFTSMQGNAAASAQQLSDGQNVVLNTLQQKMSASSGVDIDEEMASLLSLQNAYSANARVMSTVNSMFQSLLQSI